MTLPQVPECEVELLPDGKLLLTHKGTLETAVALNEAEDIDIKSTALRWTAAQRELRFITGDLH